jgi:hypothetical protein
MSNTEKLTKLIHSSYGTADLIFAGHPMDSNQAALAIAEANKEDIGLSEYLKLHKEFLKNKGCSKEHIKEQLEAVMDLASYFKHD